MFGILTVNDGTQRPEPSLGPRPSMSCQGTETDSRVKRVIVEEKGSRDPQQSHSRKKEKVVLKMKIHDRLGRARAQAIPLTWSGSCLRKRRVRISNEGPLIHHHTYYDFAPTGEQFLRPIVRCGPNSLGEGPFLYCMRIGTPHVAMIFRRVSDQDKARPCRPERWLTKDWLWWDQSVSVALSHGRHQLGALPRV